jgi:hypothetical protein
MRLGIRAIPDLRIGSVFRRPSGRVIHRSFVKYQGRTFLVYGFTCDQWPVNRLISGFKKTTLWKGDVVVACVGSRTALLRNPRFPVSTLSHVVSL